MKQRLFLLLLIVCFVSIASFTTSLRGSYGKSLANPNGLIATAPRTKFQTVKSQSIPEVLLKAQKAAFKGGVFAFSAGIVQVMSLMWLRTAVNYQYRYGGSMITALRELYKQGGIRRFYRGLPYAIVLAPITKFGATAANEGSGVLVASLGLSPGSSEFYATVLGTVFTVLWKVLLMPLETCKTVLQVDGSRGFEKLMTRVTKGNVGALYHGSAAAILATAASHYPWFYTYNLLDRSLHKSEEVVQVVLRSALIGFVASAVSDTVSNFLRILKTVKQSTAVDLSYAQITRNVYAEGGLAALLGRGLAMKIITNGIQSVLFTVMWKVLPLLWKKKEEEVK